MANPIEAVNAELGAHVEKSKEYRLNKRDAANNAASRKWYSSFEVPVVRDQVVAAYMESRAHPTRGILKDVSVRLATIDRAQKFRSRTRLQHKAWAYIRAEVNSSLEQVQTEIIREVL